jgi:hypothetical protein
VLQPDKIPVIGRLIPVSGSKIPCSPGEGISREKPAAQGLLRFCAKARPLFREEFPVDFPDSREIGLDAAIGLWHDAAATCSSISESRTSMNGISLRVAQFNPGPAWYDT